MQLTARQQLEPQQLRARLVAAVRFDDAQHDVALFLLHLGARDLEHGVGLADTRRGAEEDGELAALLSSLRSNDATQQLSSIVQQPTEIGLLLP